ncbi:hypothetical protein CANARDRAFT_121886 [[Candida] arabinofermentans NRRL YB-2248]|uniref:Fe2OG dioxygenase domain-containing protein n=1 Tax=[Candida] arabinofermentans NRRL YB-2248 TaxID=983967 RepID=A0A1E4T5J4_9ASCO|nr:hypothetical protein CANARDRAFT_121886 [[Candida] arabinofermentans NRRL YB-2248]
MPLSQEQLDQFNRDGCIAIENYLSQETVKQLNDEIVKLSNQLDITTHPMTKFTTAENKGDEHVGDDYFINSSDKVHYFLEPDAVNDNGELIKPIDKSINKIGHGLHFLNEKFNSITVNDDISSICKQLGFKDPRALQSMVIIKQPEIGGKVPSHQDGEFLYTDPLSCIGFWFALEKCTLNNGCLSYIPGSHKTNPIKKRFVKDTSKGKGTKFVDIETLKDWDFSNSELNDSYNDSDFKLVEIPAGSLVLIHNTVVHKSERNLSLNSRNAYTFHVIEGEYEYDQLNWLQVPPNKPSGTNGFTKL